MALIYVPASPRPTAPQPAAETPAFIAEREAFVRKLQSAGIFGEIDQRHCCGSVIVTPTFSTLSFKDKELFSSAVARHVWRGCPDSGNFLDLIDFHSGKKIGQFSNGRLKLY